MNADETRNFVDREIEIQEATDLIASIKAGKNPDFSIWEFNGVAGIGKSALMRLIQKMAHEDGLSSAYIDISELPRISPSKLIEYLDQQIGDTQYSIVFLDSLDQLSDSATEALGSRIILPLIDRRKVVFCLASRERVYWGTNRYKVSRRTKCSSPELLSLESTQQQLVGSSFEEFAPQIMSVTAGHPQSTNIVLRVLDDIERLENITILHENFGDFESRLLDAVLDGIQRDYLVPIDDFDSFYTLSVLRAIDVTIPLPFLEVIDSRLNWNEQQNTVDLLSRMQRSSGLLTWQPLEKCYVMNPFIRRLFSLHMRAFFPERYVQLTRAAVSYYDNRLRNGLASSSPDVRALVEKVYHNADLERLTEHRSTDLQIAAKLRSQLLVDLERLVPGGGISLRQRGMLGETQAFDTRLRTLESLKQTLRQDDELHAKLGDSISSQKFLLGIIEEYEKVFLAADHAILDIVHASGSHTNRVGDEYVAAFFTGRSEPISSCSITVMTEDRITLIEQLKKRMTVEELSVLGNWMFNKFLKDEVYNLVNEQANLKGPLTISVDDTSIPWELLHDSDDFIAFKVPLGKRFRTAEPRRTRWGLSDKPQERCLLIGVPETKVADYEPLLHVEEEVNSLKEFFMSRPEYAFIPGEDILYGREATGMALETKLLSGRYRIIHFAGHARYEISEGGELARPSLVMYDRLLGLIDIKSMTKGQPFVFLNACQSAFESSIKVSNGYVGGYTIGIASAFILAGALACVGNIWPVLDARASEFSRLFYERLSIGKSLGETLRSAKELYRLEHPFQDNPYDTTAIGYVLFGDPTQQILSLHARE